MRGNSGLTVRKRASILILLILFEGASLFADTESGWKFYPLPITEVVRVLSQWLLDSGFRVTQTPAEGGQIRLTGFKGNEAWHVVAEPRSSLASRIAGEYTVNGRPDRNKVEGLWVHLENYIAGALPGGSGENDALPMEVLSRKGVVVCLRAKSNDVIEFTGFIIDRRGLILSTAHDLSEVTDVVVTLDQRQTVEGRLVKIDSSRDLALIDIALDVNAWVPLSDARDIDGIGKRVYAITCSGARHVELHVGMADGPMRRSGGQPLLQVQMETRPGSSGSPVFDGDGNLIGVIKGRYRGTDSVGFLIPPKTVREFLGAR
jgi:serine protease Do